MPFHPSLACVACALAIGAGGRLLAQAEPTPDEPGAHTRNSSLAESDEALLRDVRALLRYLRAGGEDEALPEEGRRTILEQILSELGYSGPLPADETDEEGDQQAVGAEHVRVLPLNDIAAYVRFPSITKEAVAKLSEALASEDVKKLPWTLLDLRACRRGDPGALDSVVEALTRRRTPLIALVGVGTREAAEQVLARLKSDGAVFTVGDPTPGYPYGTRELELPSGMSVTVPEFTAAKEDGGSPGHALEPDLSVSYSGHGLDPDVFGEEDEALRAHLLRDSVVRRALDTLAAVRAFAEPHF